MPPIVPATLARLNTCRAAPLFPRRRARPRRSRDELPRIARTDRGSCHVSGAVVTGLAERLGLERALILHVDDLAMCHGANHAYLEFAAAGLVTCGSVMVPCPWFREIAEAAADPKLDLGVHLTLTSEWPHYRWRPLSTTSRASGLIDDDGYFLARRRLVAAASRAG